jgi:hypothetical protein
MHSWYKREVSGQLYPGERTRNTHWIGGRVKERKISLLWESNPNPFVVQPIA